MSARHLYLRRRGNKPKLNLVFDGRELDSRITFSRTSHAMIIDSTGKLTFAPNNLVTNSSDLTGYALNDASISANASTGVDGTATMDKIIAGTGSGNHYAQSASFSINDASSVICSVDLKAGGYTWARVVLNSSTLWVGGSNPSVYINLSNGALGTTANCTDAAVADLGGGIYRVTFKATTNTGSGVSSSNFLIYPAEANNDVTFTGNNSDGIYADRVQIERVVYETASRGYLPTSGSAYYGPRFTYDPVTLAAEGLWLEESRTNVVLWNRDMTNAVWTKTNCTAAKDQTSFDGTANAASSLTATAGNATCLQAITLASSARFQSVLVKRITGSGTIQMTMDNGTTWTNITVTAGWTRVSIPSQTLANPTVGFRIVTSGDAIAVDLVQNENTSVAPSSVMPTTSATFARVADDAKITGTNFSSFYNQSQGTWVIEYEAADVSGSTRYLFSVSDGTNNNRFISFISTQHRLTETNNLVVGTTLVANAAVADTTQKIALAYSSAGIAIAGGSTIASNSDVTPTTMDRVQIGSAVTLGTHLGGKFKSLKYYRKRPSDSKLLALVAA